jgi:dGTPase
LVKHNGPLTDRAGAPLARYRRHGVPAFILDYSQRQDLQLWSFAGAEAQVAAVADDIAYDAHDIDDGLRAKLFSLEEIAEVPQASQIVRAIRADHPDLDHDRMVHEVIRRLIGSLIDDVVTETASRLAALKPNSADDVRRAATPVGAFSREVAEADRAIKSFLQPRMYRHPKVMKVMDQAADVVRALFARYSAQPNDLPAEWNEGLAGLDEAARARHIADFIAGMTDRYALAEHARLFDSSPELR